VFLCCRKNLRNAQLYGVAFAFASSIIFFVYAGCFRFGAWLVQQKEMDAEGVFK
jgi:ATP-binding cassette subfamily B (MDR/TAP) protein 1